MKPRPLYAISGTLVGPVLAAEQVVLGDSPGQLIAAIIRGYANLDSPAERLAARTAYLAEIATGSQERILGNAVRSGAFRYEDCSDEQLGILLSHRSTDNIDGDAAGLHVRLVFVAGLEPRSGLRADRLILDPTSARSALVSLHELSAGLLKFERIDVPSRVRGPGSRR
jgi:hypothetical protein